MTDHREVVFPPHVLEDLRRFAAEAPPLTPQQQTLIRACCTKPPAKKAA